MRRSFDKAAAQSNLNVVTAFAHGARLSLGMTQSAKGGGEFLALRELIEMLDVRGITITADALHCQRETCDLIVRAGGDYCMQLKGNQGDMRADVRACVADQDIEYIDEFISVDGDHGRIEERSYRVYDVPDYLAETHQWPHLGAFVQVLRCFLFVGARWDLLAKIVSTMGMLAQDHSTVPIPPALPRCPRRRNPEPPSPRS